MKAYTDIEQSKKLAEILPLESADMWYEDIGLIIPRLGHIPKEHSSIEIPCWSLAALFSVLPKETRLLKSATDDTYHCDCPKGNIDKWFNNPVDACVKMILKLRERKIL